MGRICKTVHGGGFDGVAHYKRRELSRSFDTLEAAQKFAEGKENPDVYRANGKYKVTWYKTTTID